MIKIRSKIHRQFIHEQACIITGYTGEEIVPHHLLRVPGQHGMAAKSCDMWCVPLHYISHNALHKNGNEVVFFANHGLSYELVMKIALHYAKISPCPRVRKAAQIWERENDSNAW